jgi:hypothetical protein
MQQNAVERPGLTELFERQRRPASFTQRTDTAFAVVRLVPAGRPRAGAAPAAAVTTCAVPRPVRFRTADGCCSQADCAPRLQQGVDATGPRHTMSVDPAPENFTALRHEVRVQSLAKAPSLVDGQSAGVIGR